MRLRRQAISTLVHAAIVFFALSYACFAQGMLEPGGAGAPKYGLPGPICAGDLSYLMTPEPYSSGDQHNGFVYGWSFAKHCFMLEPPKLLIGPGNLDADHALTQNTFTFLDGAIGSGGPGFRAGAQYPPQGVYMIWGIYTFLTTTANSLYEMEMTIGNVVGVGSQSRFLVGSPTVIGGGGATCAAAGQYCQISVLAAHFQCNAAYGFSCEVRFLVRTTDAAGTAKAQTPNLGANIVSSNGILRAGGLDQLQ